MGYVSEFSPDGKLFAVLEAEGKLKIWDVKESRLSQEYVPSQPYTCFVWVSKQFRNKKLSGSTLYIALGTNRGGIELYSYATCKVQSKLKGNGHQGAVTSVCLHDDSTLYTCGRDCQIVQWSLNKMCEETQWNIGNIVPTCIVSLPLSNSLLIGCKELHLWSLGKKELKTTYTGHSTDVNSMKLLKFTEQNEEYVVTTARSNREIFLWKINDKNNPKGTFLMEYPAAFISCSIVDKGIIISAVTGTGADNAVAGGNLHLFIVENISNLGKKQKENKPKVTIAVAFDSGATRGVVPIPIVAATSNFSDPQNTLIAYGRSPILRFEQYKYNPKEKKQTLAREDPSIQFNRPDKNREHKTINPITNDRNAQYVTGSVGVLKSKSDRKPGSSEVSLESRLSTLSVGNSEHAKGKLVELLKQALHNRDQILIRNVFFNKDENVIRTTLKLLPTQYIPELVDELTQMAQKKTANVQIAVLWLKLLLQVHASHLMALGENELFDRFGSFLGTIEHRTQTLVPLTKLSGRLDFLLNQIKRNNDDDTTFDHANLLVYEDEEKDNENDEGNSNGDQVDSTDEDDVNMSSDDSGDEKMDQD